jgi:hypothetical protein
LPKGHYATNKGKYRKVNMKVKMSGPVIFRHKKGFDLMKAMTVFIAKQLGAKRITPAIMLFAVEAVCDICECGYEDRRHAHFKPDYNGGIDNYFNELARKVLNGQATNNKLATKDS